MPKSSFRKIIFILFLLFVIFLPFYFLLRSPTQLALKLPPPLHQNTPTPTPTPAFYQLTIPYLRSRSYDSHLNQLQPYASNDSYSSYLTSYSSDGLNINGLLTIPQGNPPSGGWPAVVFVHGYIPPSQYQTTQKYTDYVDFLARHGLVVFKIDLRGHGNSQGEPSGAYYSSDYVIDTLNAYSALQHLDSVNPNQVSLWGHSMAGNVVFRAFVAKADIKKIVIWAGAVYTYQDFQQFRISDTSYQPPVSTAPRTQTRRQLFDTYGDFDPNSIFWQQVVPTNYLDGLTGSIQIHHAVNDSVVNIGYSRNLISILDNTQINHQLFEYPTGGHNIEGTSFTSAMTRTADFLTQYPQK